MRKTILAALFATVLLGASAPAASATKFSGECDFKGKLVLYTPYYFYPTFTQAEGFGDGRCVGTLDGADYDGPVSIYMDVRMNRPMSCTYSLATDLPVRLTFHDTGAEMDVLAEEAHVFTEVVAQLRGAYRGRALATLTFAPYNDQEDLEECAFTGHHEQGFDMHVSTVSELYG